MRVAFIIFLGLHSIIHLIGFIKAYGLADVSALMVTVSRSMGLAWLMTSLLFLVSGILYTAKYNFWWLAGFVAVVISQVIIIIFWKAAWAGTFANIIILMVAVAAYAGWDFEKSYIEDVKEGISRSRALKTELITENDLSHLPEPVQRYLIYFGVLNSPKVHNMKIVFEGQMRDKRQDWFNFSSEQHNFFDNPTRLFFMKAKVGGLPAYGYHAYQDTTATMLVKLFSTIPLVQVSGEEMFQAETVTVFNDMCLMAPASLINKNIQWEELDELSVRATFTNQGQTISAILYFNNEGQLINFSSDDRYAIADMKKYRFSTPLGDYRTINGYRLAHFGEAVWHYPDGEFTYGKFYLKDIEYNVEEIED